VTLKGQDPDPNMFGPIIPKTAGNRLGYNGAPVGNGMRRIEWSRALTFDDVTGGLAEVATYEQRFSSCKTVIFLP